MDFHTLSRKQLQTLCKKNKIPANITNVAMADALAALNQIEGMDEFLNPKEVDAGTPDVRRASAQRKAVRGEAEGSKAKASTRPQRGAKAGIAEGVVEEENKDANVPVTPAVSRRRATAVSTRRKKESEMVVLDDDDDDDDYKNGFQGKPANVPKTPAAAPSSRTRATGRSICTKIKTPSGNSVQSTYNTRRSVRLLEKNLSKMNLMDTEDMGFAKIDDASQELSDVSQQVQDSSNTDKGASLQTVSAVVSENDHELEVSSLENNTEYGCQLNDSGSDVKSVFVTENDMGAGVQAEQQEDAEPQKVTDSEAEPHDANLKLEGIGDSNETGSELLLPVLEESCRSCELETESKECVGAREDAFPVEASKDAFQEVSDQHIAAFPVVVPDDVSVDVTDEDVAGSIPRTSVRDASVSLKEFVECNIHDQGLNEGDDNHDKNNGPQNDGEPHHSNLKVEGVCVVICDHSDEAGSVVIPLLEETSDSSEPDIENKECVGAMQDALPVKASSSGPFMEVIDHIAALTVMEPDDVSDQDAAGSPPMSSVKDASMRLKEFIGCNIDEADEGSDEGGDKQEKTNETDLEPMYYVDEKVADEKDLATSDMVLELGLSTFCSSGEHQEELLEEKPEESEESREETETIDNVSDVICENSVAVVQLFPESSADGNESMEVKNIEAEDHNNNSENLEDEAQANENVNLESSLLDVEAEEDQKNNSETLEAEAQARENVTLQSPLLDVEAEEDHKKNSENLEAEESKGCAAEDSVLDANNAFSTVLNGPQIPIVLHQVSIESTGSHTASCVLSCNSNELVDCDVVSEDAAIIIREPRVSLENMTIAPMHEQKTGDVMIQSVVCEQLKGDMLNADMMKENLATDELHKKSVGELKRMLKRLTLDDQSNCKKTIDVVKVQEVKKRTALQALPQNKMTTGDARNDG
ncbi:hypothetical protein VNO77_35818 [Canavalia gladiata]|uniref:Uncharacterized protein n=1 Tax=Canavalia gladiata TaxID=3824 RepID=A0AAN9K914_CANGL